MLRSVCGQCARRCSMKRSTRASCSRRRAADALLGLGDQQRRQHAHADQCGHGQVGDCRQPLLGGEEQRTGAAPRSGRCGSPAGRPPTSRPACRCSADLDAPGVDRDVLRRRGKCDQQRAAAAMPRQAASPGRACASPARPAARPSCASNIQLRRRPSRRVSARQRQAVDDRRPEELDRVGDANPAEHADGGALDAGLGAARPRAWRTPAGTAGRRRSPGTACSATRGWPYMRSGVEPAAPAAALSRHSRSSAVRDRRSARPCRRWRLELARAGRG